MDKEVLMYAAVAVNQIVNGYMDFLAPAKREYLAERLMRASYIEEETYQSVSEAVGRTLHIMKNVEELGSGDMTGHRQWQRRLAEVKSIMHIARSHPQAAVSRLKTLPTKKLLNA